MEALQTSLRSFVNTYLSVMWRLRECRLNDEQLSAAIGVSSSAVRSRRAKPDLWKLSDIERLATFFSVPTTACLQLDAALHELPVRLTELTTRERRRLERMLPFKKTQFDAYNVTGWPVRHLLRMHQTMSAVTHG